MKVLTCSILFILFPMMAAITSPSWAEEDETSALSTTDTDFLGEQQTQTQKNYRKAEQILNELVQMLIERYKAQPTLTEALDEKEISDNPDATDSTPEIDRSEAIIDSHIFPTVEHSVLADRLFRYLSLKPKITIGPSSRIWFRLVNREKGDQK